MARSAIAQPTGWEVSDGKFMLGKTIEPRAKRDKGECSVAAAAVGT